MPQRGVHNIVGLSDEFVSWFVRRSTAEMACYQNLAASQVSNRHNPQHSLDVAFPELCMIVLLEPKCNLVSTDCIMQCSVCLAVFYMARQKAHCMAGSAWTNNKKCVPHGFSMFACLAVCWVLLGRVHRATSNITAPMPYLTDIVCTIWHDCYIIQEERWVPWCCLLASKSGQARLNTHHTASNLGPQCKRAHH